MACPHSAQVLTISPLIRFLAAGAFRFVHAAEPGAVPNLQSKSLAHVQTEFNVFSANDVVGVEAQSLEMLTADQDQSARHRRHGPVLAKGCSMF